VALIIKMHNFPSKLESKVQNHSKKKESKNNWVFNQKLNKKSSITPRNGIEIIKEPKNL